MALPSPPPSPTPSSSAGGSEVDTGWGSDSQSSSSSSHFSDDEAADTFSVGDTSPRRTSAEREKKTQGASPLRLRGRHGRKDSVADAGDQSARAYGEALRSVRASSHRGSISVATSSTSGLVTEDTRHRHRESKKRMESADLTQQLLFRAHELDVFMESVAWLHACVVPPRWRRQIVDHLTQIHAQTQFCRTRVVAAWHLLMPPFDDANLHEYDARLALFGKTVKHLDDAIRRCQAHVVEGERESAAAFLQLWYRRALARRKFYTKTLQVSSRQSRGLIPGLFDTISATSKLTIHAGATQRTTLEYPKSPAVAKHAFLE